MGTLKVRKRILCNFFITDEEPDVQGLLNFLQTEYSLDPEHLELVSNHLNLYFLGVFHKKWKKMFIYKKSV